MIYYICFIYCDEQLRVLWKCNFSENAHTIQGPEAKSWSLQSGNRLADTYKSDETVPKYMDLPGSKQLQRKFQQQLPFLIL